MLTLFPVRIIINLFLNKIQLINSDKKRSLKTAEKLQNVMDVFEIKLFLNTKGPVFFKRRKLEIFFLF